jgi:TonB family protein
MMNKSKTTKVSWALGIPIIFLAFFSCEGQEDAEMIGETNYLMEGTSTEPGQEVFDVVENMPNPPGESEEWNQYLGSNLTYPTLARKKGIEGTVYVGFIVDADGSIRNAEILRGIGGGCDEEALQVIKKSPQWEPGIQNGKRVNVRMRMPVRFALDKENAEVISQTDNLLKGSSTILGQEVFDIVENMPKPQDGMDGWNQYVKSNLTYPSQAREKGTKGTVYVTFVVDADGSIQDTEILRGIGGGCDEEALQVIKNSPRWEPGIQNGKKVNVRMRMPIRFALDK